MAVLSLQNIAVRSIYEDYAVLQIVVVRSLVAIPCTLLFFWFEGQRGLPHTTRFTLHFWRGFLLFVAYTTYFMGLVAIPLADASAIRYAAPLFLTFFSVVILGETVGPRRWLGVIIGFAGVLLIVRPGASTFNIGALFVLITALTYALSAIITRRLKTTDSSATMSYYSTLVYLISALILSPILAYIGSTGQTHPSLIFLLRPWGMPTLLDWSIILALGLIWATGMYFVAQAYSLALASVAAPFEYTALPINILWGFLLWHEIPVLTTWLGAILTITSSLYILYRDISHKSAALAATD
jgi:drug/metabolite transporter (DMT)-like permease